MSNRRSARRITRGRSGASAGPFAITGATPTAGKLAGGTPVTVTGTSFVAGMTSALGAVSGITSTSCTITPGAAPGGIGGTLSWTLTTPNSQSASAQTYTYLAAPVASSVTPSHGPATLSSSVSLGISNSPPFGSGCPASISVGAGAVSPLVFAGPSTITGTLAPPGTGSLSLVGTIDGVSITGGSAIYTGDPAPVFSSATNIPTVGGMSQILGANFVSTPTVTISGGIATPTVAFVSSTHISITVPAGSYTAGAYDVTVTNPDGQSVMATSALTITSVLDPITILGGALTGWYRGDTLTQSSGNLVSWTDKSGNSNDLTTASGSPVVNATSANFNSQPSITFGGATWATKSSYAAGSSSTAFLYAVCRFLASSGSPQLAVFLNLNAGAALRLNSSNQAEFSWNSTLATRTGSVVNTSIGYYGSVVGTGASTENLGINVANLVETTASGVQAEPGGSTGTMTVGAQFTGSLPANVEVAEVLVANIKPNSTQLQQLYTYFNFRYALDPAMAFAGATNVPTGGGTARISGTGFNTSTTVTAASIGALTTVFRTSSILDVTVPSAAAGSYSLTMTNVSSGESLTAANALTVTAVADPMTILGTTCVFWGRADHVTVSGSNVTSLTDLSLKGQALAASSGTVTYNTTDSNFNNQPTMTFGGAANLINAAFTPDLGGSAVFIYQVLRCTASVGDAISADLSISGHTQVRWASAKPFCEFNAAVTATWGTSLLNAMKKVYIYNNTTGGANQDLAVNVNNGTELTLAATKTDLAWSTSGFALGSLYATAIFWTGQIAETIVCDVKPSSAQLAALDAYAVARYT